MSRRMPSRRMLYGGVGIIALGLLAVMSLRGGALSADDAAGKKSGDVVSRLENRIAALERRIAALEKKQASGETKLLWLPAQPPLPRPLGPQISPPDNFNGNWCYTILVDGKNQTAQADRSNSQR